MRIKLLAVAAALHLSFVAFSEEEVIPLPMEPGDDGAVQIPVRVPTAEETSQACKKFEGSFIGYYGRVFRVEKCKKRSIDDSDAVYRITMGKNKIVEVPAEIVAALPDGLPLIDQNPSKGERTCKQLAGNYLTHNFSDMYYLDGCQLFGFPDYETYVDHRKRNNKLRLEVISISYLELRKSGKIKVVPSIMDAETARMTDRAAPIEVIPIDVACKGLNDQYVTFYSLMYKVEKCKKRPIDPERALSKFSGRMKLKELSSEQWISIPDGEPLKL